MQQAHFLVAVLLLTTSCLAPLPRRPDAAPAVPAPTGGAEAAARPADTGGSPDAHADASAHADTPPLATPVPDAAGPVPVAGADPTTPSSVRVAGYQLMVGRNGAPAVPWDIKGISWSPAGRGDGKPDPSAFTEAAGRDLPLMRLAHINTVKTYGPVERAVLDQMQAGGMMAIVTIAVKTTDDWAGTVAALKSHPAVLMWVVGNEWNKNGFFGTCSGDACYDKVNEIARAVKAIDPAHPVATSFAPDGDVPSDPDLMRLDAVDVWGLNVYSQPGFFDRFRQWRLATMRTGVKKPFFMSEYGVDAYDNRAGRPDEAAQAAALQKQTGEIRGQLSAGNAVLPCLGGTPFEWNDEWWKFGDPGVQDTGGFPNGGVAPDSFANEDWWGVVDIDRRPRAAYMTLQAAYAP